MQRTRFLRGCKTQLYYIKELKSAYKLIESIFFKSKKNLIEIGKIKESKVLPVDLSDDSFILFAVSLEASDEVKMGRIQLLPKIFSNLYMDEKGSDILSLAETEIFSSYWYKFKTHEGRLSQEKKQLIKILKNIYQILSPQYSSLHQKFDYTSKMDLDILMAYAIFASQKKNFYLGENSLIKILKELTKNCLHLLDDELLLLFAKYEKSVESFSNYVVGHRRRISIENTTHELRIIKKWQRMEINRSNIKLEVEKDFKRQHLDRLGLTSNDLHFLGEKYSSMSYSDLHIFTNEVLAIPEREITILKEI